MTKHLKGRLLHPFLLMPVKESAVSCKVYNNLKVGLILMLIQQGIHRRSSWTVHGRAWGPTLVCIRYSTRLLGSLDSDASECCDCSSRKHCMREHLSPRTGPRGGLQRLLFPWSFLRIVHRGETKSGGSGEIEPECELGVPWEAGSALVTLVLVTCCHQ